MIKRPAIPPTVTFRPVQGSMLPPRPSYPKQGAQNPPQGPPIARAVPTTNAYSQQQNWRENLKRQHQQFSFDKPEELLSDHQAKMP